jgi:serine/threonine protein kinase/tetratricopeptide (TPR) repeat protein
MIGKKILHYQILEKLGEGGMGVVYLAEDTRLHRNVAIKFLPQTVTTNSESRERFKKEARAAAALNHPNIATIHAIEEVEDQIFIVMEYVEGQELKDLVRVHHDLPMPVEDCIAYTTQIAEGLQAAHEKGIVHRDIKSSNIMITEKGQVKIMDFGLAKVGEGMQLTREQSTLGTAPYMSPEQLRGNQVDQRSDIWSLGVVFYEMVTGNLPFRGDYEQAVIYAIVNEDFDDIQNYRFNINPLFVKVIKQALQKNPEHRYQQVSEILIDLKTGMGKNLSDLSKSPDNLQPDSRPGLDHRKGNFNRSIYISLALIAGLIIFMFGYFLFFANSGSIDSMAVLPFLNVSGDTNIEYLSDGVTASLINRLSELSNLKVMSRHSVVRFKDNNEGPRVAGRMLGVQAVVAGQLDLLDEKLIVDVELLNVKDGRQLWGDRFERGRTDILTIEGEIVKRISQRLKVKLAGEEELNQIQDDAIDPLAYDLYLRGRYIMLGTSDDGPARAQEFFRQAIEREPRFALAYAGLGESYVIQAWLSSRNRGDMVPLSKAALKKAIKLDATLSEVHILAGEIALYFDWDWIAADASYRRAIELNHGSDLAHREYGNYLLLMGHTEEAIAEARIAQSLDPLSVYASHQLGYSLLTVAKYSEAAAEFRKAIDLNPTWIWGNIKIGLTYALMNDCESATAAMRRADELLAGKPGSPLAQSWRAQIAYQCGDENRIRETLDRLKNKAKTTFVDPIAIADMYASLGESDSLFTYIKKGYDVRTPLMVFMLLESKSLWKEYADDPRFVELINRMNFPEERN